MASKRPINGRLLRHFLRSPLVRQAFSGVHLLIGSAPLNARNSSSRNSLPVGLLAAAELAHIISILVKAFLLFFVFFILYSLSGCELTARTKRANGGREHLCSVVSHCLTLPPCRLANGFRSPGSTEAQPSLLPLPMPISPYAAFHTHPLTHSLSKTSQRIN